MEWFLKVLKQYVDFNGRARRKEYWMYILFYVIFSAVATLIDQLIGTAVFASILGLALFIPTLAVSVRRLHDIDKSGWWVLIGLVPLIGWIWLIILLATDGTPGENEYGVNPKEVETAA